MRHRSLLWPLLGLVLCPPFVGAWSEGYYLDESLPIGLGENLERTRWVARGVENFQAYASEEPWFINWVRVDANDAGLAWRVMKGEDLVEGNEELSSLADRSGWDDWKPIAAINGDFWAAGGRPVGLCVTDQRLLTLGNGRPAIIRTENGAWHIGRFHYRVEFVAGGRTIPLEDVNPHVEEAASEEMTVVYTPEWGQWPLASPEVEKDWAALGLQGEGDLHLDINTSATGQLVPVESSTVSGEWPENLVIVVGFGASAEAIRSLDLGQSGRITISCEEFDEPVAWGVGGGPVILDDGQVAVTDQGEPGFRGSFITDQHPRTLVGLNESRSGMMMAVVDGRQPDLSAGMSLIEAAEWMRDQGMWTAMNLDGGGSSTIWVRGEILNSPSDGEERPVTDALVLLSNVHGDRLAHLEILPRDVLLPLGFIPALDVHGFDIGFNPLEFDRSRLRWRATLGARGPEETAFPARAEADFFESHYRVEDPATGVYADTHLQHAAIDHWEIVPETLQVAVSEETGIRLRARDVENRDIQIPRRAVTLAVEPPVAEVGRGADDQLSLRGLERGDADLTIRWAEGLGGSVRLWAGAGRPDRLARFPLQVGTWERETVEGFETGDQLPGLTLTRFSSEETRLSFTGEPVHGGRRALALDYAMRRGGTSAAYVSLEAELPVGARRVGLWVYGDGGRAWLRGVVRDRDGERFLVAFTGSRGIRWRDEWRWVSASLTELRPHWANPRAKAQPPLTLANIYLAQGQEALKTSGRIVLDDVAVEVFRGP